LVPLAGSPLALAPMAVSIGVGLCGIYLALLPLVKANQYYNLLTGRSLPRWLHEPLTRYANWVPIIIWRVFTADLVNFYVHIVLEGDGFPGGRHVLVDDGTYALLGRSPWPLKLRFLHVTESIALTSVFTTLKYFKSNRNLFESKVRIYSEVLLRTIDPRLAEKTERVVYRYRSIQKGSSTFIYRHEGDFLFETASRRVGHRPLNPAFDYSAQTAFSPIREAEKPGSYRARAARG
jgi:hypothetical protein